MRKEDLTKYLKVRNELKKRFLSDRLQQQEAAQIFERQFAPLIEPTRETARETKQVKEALTHLPQEIARELEQPPEYKSQLKTRPQFFNEAGRQRIVTLGSIKAAEIPFNWKDLLINPTRKPTEEQWRKMVYREITGEKQAAGAKWERFLETLPMIKEKPNDIFNEEGLERLNDDPILFALNFPKDWKNLLINPRISARKAQENWEKMVYRQYTGEKLAFGQKWEEFKSELRKKVGSGLQIKYYSNPEELFDRLDVLTATVRAGNTSREVRNEASIILDRLLKDGGIDEIDYKNLWDIFI